MPRVSKKLQMKATEQPIPPLVEEKKQETPTIERPPTHLVMIGMLVLVATSFVLGGRAFAGLKIVPMQPTHIEMMTEIQKLHKKIDALDAKLDALNTQCDAVANACTNTSDSSDDTPENEPLSPKEILPKK